MLFRSNDTATTEIYTSLHTLSLHDALPITLADVQLEEEPLAPSGWGEHAGRAPHDASGSVDASVPAGNGFEPLDAGAVGGPTGADGWPHAGLTVQEMERRLIFETLRRTNNNRTHAARMLGISVRTLRNKLHEYRAVTNAGAP